MIWPRSLQARLSLALGVGVAVVWIVATVFTSINLTREMRQVFDRALQETAQRILPLAGHEISDRGTDEDFTLEEGSLASEMLAYIIVDNNGKVRLRSGDLPLETFRPGTMIAGFSDTPTYRLYAETDARGDLSIIMADPLSHRQEATKEAFLALIWPLAFLIPVSMLGVWLVVRGALRALVRVRSEIESRGNGDLSALAPGKVPTEIEPVVGAVNALMRRLARAIGAERSFTANSAHELRTPIAAALAQTQRLIAETKSPETRTRAAQIESALGRLARLSEKLMQLAKSEGAGLIAPHSADLVPVLELVIQDFKRLGDAGDRIETRLPQGSVMARIDPDAFAILLRNLVENGLKHGDPEKPVVVHLTAGGELQVLSPGREIDPATLATLTRPFARGETTASGTGLGLAIVKAIATGVGGAISLHAPMRNGESGLEVVVTLV